MPTLTTLAGWKRAAAQFDGQEIWPVLSGAVETPAPRTIYIPMTNGPAVLDGDWKLIVREKKTRDKEQVVELFHITQDPYEKNDLAPLKPDRVRAIQAKLAELRRGDLTELPAAWQATDNGRDLLSHKANRLSGQAKRAGLHWKRGVPLP
jgi:arylsulfatase A-like enzyme